MWQSWYKLFCMHEPWPEVMQTNQVRILTLDYAWSCQYGQSPSHRCCPSCQRMVTKSVSPFPPAACPSSLGFHPLSSPPILILQWSESAALLQRDSSWQHRPVGPWLGDMYRLQILKRQRTVEAVIKEIQSPNSRVQCHTRPPWLACRTVCHIAKGSAWTSVSR